MAVGPRRKGGKRRLVGKPRRPRRGAAPPGDASPWTPAAYRAREVLHRQREMSSSDQPAGRGSPRPDAPVLESDWTLAACAAREAMRAAQEASPPILESDWTLAAYRARMESVPATSPAPTKTAASEDAPQSAPEIRIDARPARFDRPAADLSGPSPASRRRPLVYLAGAAAAAVVGALLLRSPSPPPPPAAPRSAPEPNRPPTPVPAKIPAPNASTALPVPAAPPAEPLKAAPVTTPDASTGGQPALANPPPAAGTPQATPPAQNVPANKSEAGAQQSPATTATPARPAESRATNGAKKTRQKPARERRAAPSLLDQLSDSVKRLGRFFTR